MFVRRQGFKTIGDARGLRQDSIRATGALGRGLVTDGSPGLWRPAENWAMLAGDCKIGRGLPFIEAPVLGNFAVPKQRLHQVWHGCDLVKLMDRILIAVVVDDKHHAMALETGITWYCNIPGVTRGRRVLPARNCCGPRRLRGLSPPELVVDGTASFWPLGTFWCGPHEGTGPCAEEGPGCKIVTRALRKDASEWCAGGSCQLDTL